MGATDELDTLERFQTFAERFDIVQGFKKDGSSYYMSKTNYGFGQCDEACGFCQSEEILSFVRFIGISFE